jgi:hypothetical protein
MRALYVSSTISKGGSANLPNSAGHNRGDKSGKPQISLDYCMPRTGAGNIADPARFANPVKNKLFVKKGSS